MAHGRMIHATRENTEIGRLEKKLENLCSQWTEEAYQGECDPNKLHKLEDQIGRTEYLLYCERYEEHRMRNW